MMKKNIWKKAMAVVLSAAIVLSMIGCGGGEAPDDDGDGKLNANVSSNKDYDTVVDMEGYEFTISSPFLLDEPVLSEITESEAIFEQVRRQVEQDYNCKITILPTNNTISDVRPKIMSGDKIADIIDVTAENAPVLARSGYIIPYETIDGIDLTDSRWVQGYTKLSEFNGEHYGVNFMQPAEVRTCLIYNRTLLKECGITEDPQELVLNNQWTFDKFREMCKNTTRDTNGDGTNDSYGLFVALPQLFNISMIAANGGSLVKMEGGVAKANYNTEGTLTALNYTCDLINTDKTVAYDPTGADAGKEKEFISRFVQGEYAFFFCESWQINQLLKPTAGDMDYGILPLPMGPDATDYVSPAENARFFCITSTNKEVEKTVIILNALARYIEAYGEEDEWWTYELSKDYFQEGDEKSIEIYKLILDKSHCDLGSSISDLWNYFRNQIGWVCCFENKSTPQSLIESIAGKYKSSIDAIYN